MKKLKVYLKLKTLSSITRYGNFLKVSHTEIDNIPEKFYQLKTKESISNEKNVDSLLETNYK